MTGVIARVEAKARYVHSTWGLLVADAKTGQVLVSQNAEKLFTPGSTLKLYSAAAALHDYGAGHRFRTPVYRTGSVRGGVLSGNLVLVASGDFSFGLRDRPNGTQAYNTAPQLDHSDADGGPGPTLVPHSNPLAGVEQLARQVRAAGIRKVNGNVVIDDRLFNTYSGWPDGVMSPIGINENFIDITATPTSRGRAARISYRPRTAAWHVRSTVKTAARGSAPSWQVTQTGPREVTVSGTVPAGAGPLLQVFFIPNPAAFARTAFIEALRRAGVSVAASSVGPNPRNLLPRSRHYPSSRRVALRLSAPLSQIVKVILKVSANRGADLLVCLVAVKHGQRNCPAGLAYLQRNAARAGIAAEHNVRLRRRRLRRPRSHQPDRDHHVPAPRATPALRVGIPRRPAGRGRERDACHAGQGNAVGRQDRGQARQPRRLRHARRSGSPERRTWSATSRPRADARSCSPTCINNIPLTAAYPEVFSIFDDQQLINGAFQQAF